jgi:hypothetical protein
MLFPDWNLLAARDEERRARVAAAGERYRILVALQERPPAAPPHHAALAWLGRRLVRWGCRLAIRYGEPSLAR